MANVWTQFKELLPSKYQYIGEVTTVNTDGTSIVTLEDLSTVTVYGDTIAAGKFVLIEGNVIVVEVADLPTSTQEI